MENSQLIGLSRQAMLRRQLDVIANNLANMNTLGFKGEDLLFQEYLMPRAQSRDFTGRDRIPSFVQDRQMVNDFTAGGIVTSGNPLDVAIDGDGWFTVQGPDGDLYTRAGNFSLDSTGMLVNGDGYPVMSGSGTLTFTPDETDIHIASDGTISSSEGVKGQLRLVRFDNLDELVRAGGTAFSGGQPIPATGQRVVQGAVEKSNVLPVVEITRLIDVTRAYTSVAKTLADSSQLTSEAIDQLGRLS